jgi:peptide/nickel transport system substrate-binding protein
MTADEMLASPDVTDAPLSHGPYTVQEWARGEQLVLQKNPFYYRATEGLPNIDQVTIRFDVDVSDATQAITSGDCDVITEDGIALTQLPTLVEGEAAGEVRPYFTPNLIFEHVDFGINSWGDYGDGVPGGRPDWFEFIAVRQGIAHCIDRQRMVDEFFAGQSQIMNGYIPNDHPLYPQDALDWPYDPDAGNAALEGFGLIDTDGDGLREFVERDLQNTIVATTTFSITLGTDSESAVRLRINEMVQEDLAACGIAANLYDVPAERWYDDGPFSALFGRRFDLATYAWLTGITPPCSLYLSTNITGPEEQGFGGWGNINATGWVSEEYDLACQAALDALPGTAEYNDNHSQAVRIFNERVPAIPLFQYVNTAVSAPTVSNIKPNSSQPSELWNIFEWDVELSDED